MLPFWVIDTYAAQLDRSLQWQLVLRNDFWLTVDWWTGGQSVTLYCKAANRDMDRVRSRMWRSRRASHWVGLPDDGLGLFSAAAVTACFPCSLQGLIVICSWEIWSSIKFNGFLSLTFPVLSVTLSLGHFKFLALMAQVPCFFFLLLHYSHNPAQVLESFTAPLRGMNRSVH